MPQPNSDQVNWAIQQADRNLLTNAVLTRPANFLNSGVPSYRPSSDFPRRQLSGAGASTPIPPSVIQAVFAQESNWRHATWRALPGVSGNPLVGDYYGSGGTLDVIDLSEADCGYGVSQVTTPMTAASHIYSLNGKVKVAVDYAENVAAGIQFLVDAWNKLHGEGMLLNGGSVSSLENWYFAAWMYNTGYNPPDAAGREGLGWTNNPMNADYPPDRPPFLRVTYADAEHPNDWPYQERVFGWMERPQLNYQGDPNYAPPIYPPAVTQLQVPDRAAFCAPQNSCDPNHLNGNLSYCTLANRHCWWNEPADFAACPTNCATSEFTVATTAPEPEASTNYPPNCNQLPPSSQVGQPTVIVDNQPNSLNVEGCDQTDWLSAGSFALEFGENAQGSQLGQIDWHQLGTGFAGHTWFTKNRAGSDTAHINKGTWTPPTLSGFYAVHAHVPPSGASTPSARYRIYDGQGGVHEQVVDQHLHENRWVNLGEYALAPGTKVELTNITGETVGGTTNVAFDAIAFVPVSSSSQLVETTVDAALIFDDEQSTTASDNGLFVDVSNPNTSDTSVETWMLDHTDPILRQGGQSTQCPGSPSATCVMTETWDAISGWEQEVQNSVPAVWQGYANADPSAVLPTGYLNDPGAHKHRNTLRIRYRRTPGGEIDMTTVAISLESQAGITHLADGIRAVFEAVEDDYGVPPPDLTYTVENLGTYSHANSTADPYAIGGAPGRAFRPVLDHFPTGNGCIEVHAIGGGIIGWKPALNEGGIAGSVERWKDDIDDLADAGVLPASVYELADGIYHFWFSNQYGTQLPISYEGSLYRRAPPIWMHMDFEVCGDGNISPLPGDNLIARSSFMPHMYIWVDGQSVDGIGTANPSGTAVALGNFLSFTRNPTHPHSAFNLCSFGFGTTEDDNRHGNPWDIGAVFDGKDHGTDVYPCRPGFSVSDH